MDSEIIKWLATNWPTVLVAITLAGIFIRIERFIGIQARDSKRIRKVLKFHSSHHPEDSAELFDDESKEE